MAHTVRGPVPVENLGITLCHEHLLIDMTQFLAEVHEASRKALTEAPVGIEILGELRRDPMICRDNLFQGDVELAIREASHFKRAGGRTVVDCTPVGLGRDVRALRIISEATDLNIIAGTGWYTEAFQTGAHKKYVSEKNDEELASVMIREIEQGVADTGIRCGIIGEIGTAWPVTPIEQKIVRAAVYAQKKTRAPISMHVDAWARNAHAILDILEREGADFEKVVLDHVDEGSLVYDGGFDLEYALSLAKRGCYIGFDTFGVELYLDAWGTRDPIDAERVAGIRQLVERGYCARILLSHDVGLKTNLKTFGGYGFDHLLTHITPMFRRAGLAEEHINQMFVENPKRFLGF